MRLSQAAATALRASLLAPIFVASLSIAPAAFAAPSDAENLQAALEELRELKAAQVETSARISELERALTRTLPDLERIEPKTDTLAEQSAQTLSLPADALGGISDRLDVTGDLLLRYEANDSGGQSPERERGVMRARLGATYKVDDRLTVGGLLETGDPDDPNSGYLTMSNFADDLHVSLSRAYARYDFDGATVYGGKFPKPFTSTDLLWDGDVNPVGVAVQSSHQFSEGSALNLSGLLFVVDESAAGDDSQMFGGQAHYTSRVGEDFKFELAAGYYDYELGSVAGANAGDFRTNLLQANGDYLSDYNLLDLIARVSWSGLSERWPVSLTVDRVVNFGAEVDSDMAFGVDLGFGRKSEQGDWSLAYGYGEAEVDAVLAAFSNDNYTFGTNYMAHEFGANYVVNDHVNLTAAYYHYKPLEARYAGALQPDQWLDRLRFNIAISY